MKARIIRIIAAIVLCSFLTAGSVRPAAADQETVHILLIGLDGRPGISGCRSDTIVLCSYQAAAGKLTMTSFLRDLYIPIPGKGSNRINAAYALGGRKLLKSTLEHNFGITVEGCVEVDFNQFSSIIDALGGVSLELRRDEAGRINEYCSGSALSEGLQLLSGEQALCYTRIRDLDRNGDFSRTMRQQKVLQAILKRWKDADLKNLLETVRGLIPMISTDLSPVQILNWVFSAAPARSSILVNSLQIPAPGTFRDASIDGMSVLLPDIDANKAALHDALTK